ncbi:MAG: uracil phosphoribosyltransferase [Methanobacterium sp.]|nr:uracil phosphoribosyltransferase [Methanobacterium sp.]
MLKILKNIVLQDRLTKIRDSNIDRVNFKSILLDMGRFIAYELQSTMDIHEVNVKTSLGTAKGIKINETDNVVVIAILRAALPLVEGIMSVFNEAEYGVVGVWRENEPPFQANMGYIKIPDIENKIVIIADPMLATGNTMNATLNEIKKQGKPRRLAILNIIATEEGVEKVLENHSEVEIYTCSIENKLKEGYIVPGLGDAGDIAFGKPIH